MLRTALFPNRARSLATPANSFYEIEGTPVPPRVPGYVVGFNGRGQQELWMTISGSKR